MQTHRRDHR